LLEGVGNPVRWRRLTGGGEEGSLETIEVHVSD
jgi:hypothetical protein